MQRHSCRPCVHESTRPVLVERTVLDGRQRLLGERLGFGPVVTFDRHDAALGEEDGDERKDAGAGRRIHGAGEEGVRPVEITFEQVREALGVEHRRPIGTGRAEPVPSDLRVTAHLLHPVATQQGAEVGQGPSIVLPSSSVPVVDVRSAAAAQRSVPAGWPANACISAPCTAIAGKRSTRPLASNHSIQRITVWARPLAQTGLAICNTRRATRSASPAAWA